MEKATERLTISFSKEDIKLLDRLKIITNQNTYSKAVQVLVRYGKL